MRTVTALRARDRARVVVELDGRPWRTLPLEPVVRAGLAPGIPLDRERARTLARELRRSRSLGAAARALRHRDLTARALDARLVRAGIAPGARRDALDALARAGAVDDGRFASTRAAALAARGYGDAAIRWDLEQKGVAPATTREAVDALEPEVDRARRAVATRADRAAAARFLARRGFGEEAAEAALADAGAEGRRTIG